MKLLVVIVNYRVTQLAIDCLHSVAKEIASVPGMHVAICENGSGDGSAELIQRAIDDNGWSSWCTLKALEINLGFTGGNNAVLRPVLASPDKPEYFLLLNSDTIARPNAFKALIDFMDSNPEVGIGGSRLEDPDGTPQRSAFRFQSPLGEFESSLKLGFVSRLLSRWVVAPPVVDHAFETDWVSGASMIIRRETMEATGLLDEGFFTYFDDIDYCFNAKKRGWPSWYVPASRVVHLVGQSTGVNSKPKRLPPYLLDARQAPLPEEPRRVLRRHGRHLQNRRPVALAIADSSHRKGRHHTAAAPFQFNPAQRILQRFQDNRRQESGLDLLIFQTRPGLCMSTEDMDRSLVEFAQRRASARVADRRGAPINLQASS